jgi:hypothetical protein
MSAPSAICSAERPCPALSALLTIVLQWKEALGTTSSFTMREIISAAVNRPNFYNALLTVAAAGWASNLLSNERLGRWLKANENKIAGGFSIVRDALYAHLDQTLTLTP